uniref:BTB domain-containing protein n=1 Tax=Romanomermis culicivorax TaxID=13658 RepID=A0A915HRT6_ROMCU
MRPALIILPLGVAEICINNALQACAMYHLNTESTKLSKSRRAGLQLTVGKFQRWLQNTKVASCIYDQSAVFLTSVIETLLEELILKAIYYCNKLNSSKMLTAERLLESLENNAQIWGLFQAYEHLICYRSADGILKMPEFKSMDIKSPQNYLLATCVGNYHELNDLVKSASMLLQNLQQCLFNSSKSASKLSIIVWKNNAVETPYSILPPLIEWVKICNAFSEYRQPNGGVVDHADVLEAARILIPNVDYPLQEESLNINLTDFSMLKMKRHFAYCLLRSGQEDSILQAIKLLGASDIDFVNHKGLTLLMEACSKGDDVAVKCLLDAGANVNRAVSCDPFYQEATPVAGWTPLTFAVAAQHFKIAKQLLESGASVELPSMIVETPLQVVAMTGNCNIVNLLLAKGADPYWQISKDDSSCLKQKSSSSAAVVLASCQGHRDVLQLLLARRKKRSEDILSLEDFLAEVQTCSPPSPPQNNDQISDHQQQQDASLYSALTKSRQKILQEAIYQAAEQGHVDVVMDLRSLGVPWNLHVWSQTLFAGHEMRRKALVQLLLNDFSKYKLDELTDDFVEECLPLLFDILKRSKNDIVAMQISHIISQLHGLEDFSVYFENLAQSRNLQAVPRVDPKFVNNPEMSDIQFLVENRVFYAHRIVLVNASEKFKDLLLLNNGSQQISQRLNLDDVKYEIFEMAIEFLYNGSFSKNDVKIDQLLELVDFAKRFDLEELKISCESLISSKFDIDNCCDIYQAALIYDAINLIHCCHSFFLQNLPKLMSESNFFRKMIYNSCSGINNSNVNIEFNRDLTTDLLTATTEKLDAKLTTKTNKIKF